MVPLSVKNYGLGVLDVGYVPIAVASSVFSPFYAFQNMYMGSMCQNLAEVLSSKKTAGASDGRMSQLKALLPVVFNVLLVIAFMRALKAQLRKQRES
eukprot:2214599-Amphidinium_carterae.1